MKKTFYFYCGGILALYLSSLLFARFIHQSEIKQARIGFINQWKSEQADVAHKIQSFFKAIYEAGRTISLLPGVREIDRPTRKLDKNSIAAIQEIYNNAYLNSKLSEVYILPKKLDPYKTNKLETQYHEPFITFDEFIVGKSGSKKESEKEKKEELPEEEIYEYVEMKEHLLYFAKNYPNNNTFKNINVPSVVSSEVITCDNTDFTINDYKKKKNDARMGLVMTLPRYFLNGSFSGGVSVVFRSKFLKEMIPMDFFQLAHQKSGFKFPTSLASHSFFNHNLKLNIPSLGEWTIKISVPEKSFHKFPQYQQTNVLFQIVYTSLTLFFIGLLFVFWRGQKFKLELESKVEERTRDLKNSQEQLVQSSKMASLGQMAGGVAHEINNPMAIIDGTSRRLKKLIDKKKLDENTIKESVDKILKMTNRIEKIINGMRTFSRKEKVEELSKENLKELFAETFELFQVKLKEYNCAFEMSIPENIDVNCRPIELSQVILNLVNNAADATSLLGDRWVKANAFLEDEFAIIKITDSGPGIAPEIVEKIFDPFYTSKEIGKGTGLGLSISRKIIESFHGDLYIDTENKNTCFVIKLSTKEIV